MWEDGSRRTLYRTIAAQRVICAAALFALSIKSSGTASSVSAMPFENAYSGFTLKGAGKKEAAIPRVAVADISPKDFFKRYSRTWLIPCSPSTVEGL